MTYWDDHRGVFKALVREANPHFARFKQSSLQKLIDLLKKEPAPKTPKWSNQVLRELQRLARKSDKTQRCKANKYKNALYHLTQKLPVQANMWSVGTLATTNVYKFHRVLNVPANFDPSQVQGEANVTRLVANGQYLVGTPEEFVIRGLVDGIFVIHMEAYDDGAMGKVFDGWKTIDHMNAVLRVGARSNPPVPLYVLEMGNNLACQELGVAARYPGAARTRGNWHQHAAWSLQSFRTWLTGKQTVLVMGYDGDVCVDANLFGTNQKVPSNIGVGVEGGGERFVKPLVSQVDVVTSRALLATSGNLYPPNQVGQYGQLTAL